MPGIAISPSLDADDLIDSEQLAGTDFQILLDALNTRDSRDVECCREAREGSALQRHHSARLKASSKLAEKLRRMAAASRNA
ncbi:hypothetical protein [Azohydromonas aeria]|uniref:hypothetical protein n=1 Tax=Azohydromonas aeria TaxID=2590212 RepID=UPI0012FBA8F8|nr:hypothetical protein [Azohydromonas aeria]